MRASLFPREAHETVFGWVLKLVAEPRPCEGRADRRRRENRDYVNGMLKPLVEKYEEIPNQNNVFTQTFRPAWMGDA